MKKIAFFWALVMCSANILAQDSSVTNNSRSKLFIGYDLGEMAFNNFQNFGGEIGLKFKNDHMLRFVYLNVKLTEKHLASDFAKAVDGNNVTGLWHGYEMFYDLPIFRFREGKSFVYAGPSIGYHENRYQHTQLDESVDHKTGTVGFDIGFRESDVFKVKGLYYSLSIPFRYNFKPLEETKLGESTVNKSVFDQTISFFVGYQF